MKHDNETIPLSTSNDISAVEKLKAYIHQANSSIDKKVIDNSIIVTPVVHLENSFNEKTDEPIVSITTDEKSTDNSINEIPIVNLENSFDEETDESIVSITTADGSIIKAHRIFSSNDEIDDLTDHENNTDVIIPKKQGIRIKNPNASTIVKKQGRFSRKSMIVLSCVAALSVCIAGAWLANSKVMTASAEPQTETTETSTSSSAPLTTAELTSPNERTSQELAGGYTFTQTKYYPLDSKKSYSDFTLTKSDSSDIIDTSDEAKAIENKLKEKLPVIDETITVKDGSKVTFETYKKGSVFYTILLYDNVPFGYVSTEDGVTTSYVTSYYVKNVMKEN